MSINQKDIFKHFSSSQEVAGEHFFSRSFSVFMKVMEEKKFSAAAVKLQLTHINYIIIPDNKQIDLSSFFIVCSFRPGRR